MEILKTQLIISTIALAIAAIALIVLLVLYIRKAMALNRALFVLFLLLDEEPEDPFDEFRTGGGGNDKGTVQKSNAAHIDENTVHIVRK